jgi:hypothetical protein
MSERKLVSSEVASRLGISRQGLIVYLARNTDLKPAERLPDNDFLWSEEEIQRLIERRQRRKVKT